MNSILVCSYVYLRKFPVFDHCKHIGRHSPQACHSLNSHKLDSDLDHNAGNVLAQFGTVEVDIIPNTQISFGLLCEACSGELDRIDHAGELIIGPATLQDRCVNLGDIHLGSKVC